MRIRLNRARLYIANSAEIKLRRQAKAFLHLAPFGYNALASYLAGDNTAASSAATDANALSVFRDAVKAEENLLILIGSELRGADLKKLITFGLGIPGAKFALLSDYVNSRGAADMGARWKRHRIPCTGRPGRSLPAVVAAQERLRTSAAKSYPDADSDAWRSA